ncbi:hypothetical protein [Clostridium sp.]
MESIVVNVNNTELETKGEKAGYLTSQFNNINDRNKTALIAQLKKIPGITNTLNELKKNESFKIVIPPGFQEKIDKGVSILAKREDGTYYPTIKNSVTKRYEKHVRLSKVEMNLAGALDKVVIQNMLTQVVIQMENISEQISRIFVELQNDRIALVESSQQQYIEAINTNDEQFKKYILANTIKTAHDARAQLIMNFEEDFKFIEMLPDADENLKLARRIAEDKMHLKDFNKELKAKTYNLHKSLEAINRSSGVIAFVYQELGEVNNIYISLQPYKELLSKLSSNEDILKKLYDYSDIKISDVWNNKPKQVLNKIELLESNFKSRNNKELIIEIKGRDLLEDIGGDNFGG